MNISICLNESIDCNVICQKIINLVNSYQNTNGNAVGCLLFIEIKKPIEYNDSLKLEYSK